MRKISTAAQTNTNPNAEAPNKSDGSQTSPPQPSISEARLRANRESAKKSTGPKTARGKTYKRNLLHAVSCKADLSPIVPPC